jgi:hypothetical protein
MTFTTATAMPTTTLSQTLNVSVDWNTDAVIRWRMNNLRARKNTWSAFVTKLKSGMLAQKDTNGILSTDEELGKIVQHSPSFAPLADQVLKPTSIGPCSVPVAANNAGLVVVRLSKADTLLAAQSLHADAADETSSPNGQKPLFIAQRLAACVTAVEALSKPVRVRNLTVSNAHTFYANGMLTHNCDAMGLCGQLLDVMVAGREAKQTKNVVNIGYRRLERQVEGFKTL